MHGVTLGGKYVLSPGKLFLKLKSVKGRNKVGETHLLLINSHPLLLARVSCNLAAKRDPTQPLLSRYALTTPCNYLLMRR